MIVIFFDKLLLSLRNHVECGFDNIRVYVLSSHMAAVPGAYFRRASPICYICCSGSFTCHFSESPGFRRLPSVTFSLLVADERYRRRIVKGATRRQGSGGGVVAVMMDGVARCCEVELRDDEMKRGQGVKKEGRVKAVFFDLDDTLVLTHAADKVAQQAVQAGAERQVPHVNGAEMVKVFVEKFDVSPWDPTHQVDVLEWRARIWGEALQRQGVKDMNLARVLYNAESHQPNTPEDMQNLFDRERMLSFQWAPGVEVMVRSLHKFGIKVGIITNGHFSVQRTKLKACKADLLFDTILVGGEEPNQKPHRDIFLKACKLAGCNPEETLMVGDNLKTDIQGGINAGFLATVWVNVHNLEGPPAGGASPDYIISSITELPGILRTLDIDLGSDDP